MSYRAKKTFKDSDEAFEVLSQLPGEPSYRVAGSMYQRKPSVIFSEHTTKEAIEETYSPPAYSLDVTINYDSGTVKLLGRLGPLPVSSMKASFERPSWPEFRDFLEQTGEWK